MRELIYLLHWADFIEIFSLFCGIYFIFRWLAASNTNLIEIAYGYILLISLSSFFDLYALKDFLFMSFPVGAVLMIIFHQHHLQRNFVTARNDTKNSQSYAIAENWLDSLMRALFRVATTQEGIRLCIIEKNSSLSGVLGADISLHLPCTYDLLMAIQTFHKNSSRYVWVKSSGILVAVDAYYSAFYEEYDGESGWGIDLETWKQEALLLTIKTDAVVMAVNGFTRRCTLIHEGKIIDDVGVAAALRFIKQKIEISPLKGREHEKRTQKVDLL